jgi:hypothetical protein
VLWYTATGMVLGGLYGCAFVAVAMFLLDASEAIEHSDVWGGISLWNAGSGRHIRTLDGKFASGISFSPDGCSLRAGPR